jgi:hypothetical protein
MHHLLLKKITKTLGLGWFGVVYSWSLCILGYTYSLITAIVISQFSQSQRVSCMESFHSILLFINKNIQKNCHSQQQLINTATAQNRSMIL